MAKCPKCGVKISPFDWRAECKNCGANLMTYNMEARLDEDEKKAAEEYEKLDKLIAKFQPLIDFFKGIGEKIGKKLKRKENKEE